MIYDKDSGKIRAGVKELVNIAKRNVPATASFDFDGGDTVGFEKELPEDFARRELSFEVTVDGTAFDFFGTVPTNGKEIFLARKYTSTLDTPKKDDIKEARGEGFIFAYMLATIENLDSVMLTIVYINSKTAVKTVKNEIVEFKNAKRFFDKCTAAVTVYARPEIERVTERLPSMQNARFPYGKVRAGQEEFMSAVYKNLTRGGTLYAVAPTGTGKTVSVIYPAIRALGGGKCDKIFYFTPKTTTAAAAKDCIEDISKGGVQIKAVMISAKERICKRGVLCREGKNLCPSVFGKELTEATLALYDSGVTVVTEKELLKVAGEFGVCPHELSLSYSELCDAVILDVNYLFDPRVYIKRYFTEGGRFAFLIDEAHNLPDRAREMYSAEISTEFIALPAGAPEIGEHSPLIPHAVATANRIEEILYDIVKDEIREGKDGEKQGFAHVCEPPCELYDIFDGLTELCESEMLSALRAKDEGKQERIKFLRDYHAKIKRVSDTLAIFDGGFEMFVRFENGALSFKLFCIDTSVPISRRIEKGHAAVFFSATLAPMSYYRSVLGRDYSSSALEIASPFDSSQLSVTIMDKISTRHSEREDTLVAVSRVIAATISAKRGHYMIFSPSFAYSEALYKVFSAKYPKIKILLQKRNMTRQEKTEFLEQFEKNDGTYLVAFAVTGSIFSEGIDLVGDSLIGAVIVGISIPALSSEREAIAAYYDEKCDEGKQFAYIYPGINRVLQAGGRVIRREGDKGVIVLIDDRFADPIYKKSMPELWSDIEYHSDPKALRERLDKFWQNGENT